MKKITQLLLLLSTLTLFAQKEANNWVFGVSAGIHFEDDGSVNILPGNAIATNEGCSSISDVNGNLLFYTDGRNVWDRNNTIMPNGNYPAGTGLLGDPSSTQSAIIVPNKNNPNLYYIFTVDEPHQQNAEVYPNQFTGTYTEGGSVPLEDDGFNNGLNYSIVDLSLAGSNGSIGDITTRNVHLVTYNPTDTEEIKYKCSEKITSVRKSNGTGYWVITQFIDKFYAFEITAAGVNLTPIVTQLAPLIPTSGYRRNAIGCIKASPNGKKIAIAHTQVATIEGSTEENGTVYLYNFNDLTGLLSSPIAISTDTMPYGVEFSPKSKKLYVTYNNSTSGFGGVHQYDLLSNDIPGSDVLIQNTNQAGTLQLGPNGKIYKAVVNSKILDVINDPEEDGALCNYMPGEINLGTGICFFGLPPFITSYFFTNIVVTHKCFGNATSFALNNNTDVFDSISWNFGDGSPASTAINPTRIYTAAGNYTVTASIMRQGQVTVVSADFSITPAPVANTPNTLKECDPDNNRVTAFNLSNNTPVILGAQNAANYEVKYFNTQANADANTASLNDTAYNNISDPQTIYARIQSVVNPECYTSVNFQIQTLSSPVVSSTANATVCLNTKEFITLEALETPVPGYTYSWSTGETTPRIQVNTPGVYVVTVTNSLGCSTSKTITVTASNIAAIDDIIINDLRDNNTVTVITSSTANAGTTYLYSLDKPNGPYQESNLFENVTPGTHTVYVYDTKGCGVVPQKISVLSIPKFFTPNGDGVNETWNIIGINAFFYSNSKIYIFDRYGKLLADVNPKGLGWDGTHKGFKLPSTDYWYVVQLDSGRTVKGHFSLIR
ncbi:T9SS type B sorting domain-containing protein [Flavobacterium cerinum]|uniref:T9SS type B sorting domain-containing protein n=1 Tax=Flavobacterium cerinum TaxID=2502784 RepID=A0A3S3U1A6_9FLAO|nr:T9SS type B sorting domain-containing protein [Flavobacterium cerinum]RWX01059.1 T9SS type B sorting domain-containing protein [Flavobacterium cerinum]